VTSLLLRRQILDSSVTDYPRSVLECHVTVCATSSTSGNVHSLVSVG